MIPRTYGEADRRAHARVEASTVFHIASVSKYILSAAVLQLVDQGRIRLDGDIRTYIPEAPTQGRRVTIAELLNHTSGIPSFTSRPDAEANEALDLDHPHVLALFAHTPFDFEPGSSRRYDNSAFYLAGMLVERVTGRPYGDYVQDRPFGPLGMSKTSLCDSRRPAPGLALGYEFRGGQFSDPSPMTWRLPSAAGAVCGTAEDLLKWERALDGGRIVSRATLAQMREPTKLPDGAVIHYGFGTRLGRLQGHPVVGHTGGGGGHTAVLEHFPADDLTIVILANTRSAPLTQTAAAIARAALHVKQPQVRDMRPPARLLAETVGAYDSDEGPVEQLACGWRLCLRIPGTHSASAPLRWQGDDEFAVDRDFTVRYVVRSHRAIWSEVYSGD